MPDAAFQQNMQIIHCFCLHALLLIEEEKSRAIAALAILIAGLERAEKPLIDSATARYRAAIADILGTWEAWQEFCGIAGVDPEAVMRGCTGRFPNIIDNYLLLDEGTPIAANPQAKAAALSLFTKRWLELQECHSLNG